MAASAVRSVVASSADARLRRARNLNAPVCTVDPRFMRKTPCASQAHVAIHEENILILEKMVKAI
jgi:hypothetical protein